MNRTLAIVLVVVAMVAGFGAYLRDARAGGSLQGCDDWVQQTNDRVNDARTLLYPADRPGAFQGSAEQAAQELFAISEEQVNSEPPDGAGPLNDDLIEALTVGAEGLAAGGVDAAAQVVFAKAIVYNADVRLLAVIETC